MAKEGSLCDLGQQQFLREAMSRLGMTRDEFAARISSCYLPIPRISARCPRSAAVRTGAKLPGSEEARKAAIAVLDAADKDKLKRAIAKSARERTSRSPGRQWMKGSQAVAPTVGAYIAAR